MAGSGRTGTAERSRAVRDGRQRADRGRLKRLRTVRDGGRPGGGGRWENGDSGEIADGRRWRSARGLADDGGRAGTAGRLRMVRDRGRPACGGRCAERRLYSGVSM